MPADVEAPDFPALWAQCVNAGRFDELLALYGDDAVLMPTFAPDMAKTRDAVNAYFKMLAARDGLTVTLHADTVHCRAIGGAGHVVSGIYDFTFAIDGAARTFPSRFTFVIDLALDAPILHHHSSPIPEPLG